MNKYIFLIVSLCSVATVHASQNIELLTPVTDETKDVDYIQAGISNIEYIQKYPQPFIGIKAGYQLAFDDDYDHNEPSGGIWGVNAGLQFTKELSWDIGYQSHENLYAEMTLINVETSLLESAVRYDYFVNDNVSLYGRLGAAYWDMDKTSHLTPTVSAQGVSPLAEIGVSSEVASNLSFSAGYQYIGSIGDASTTGQYDSHALFAGLTYKFGRTQEVINEPKVIVPVELPKKQEFKAVKYSFKFAFDKAVLSSIDDFSELKAIAKALLTYPQAKVTVIGYTDSIGAAAYNQTLSEKRAFTVVKALKALGVKENQITSAGQGESNPIMSNMTKSGRADNRRVEVSVAPFEY